LRANAQAIDSSSDERGQGTARILVVDWQNARMQNLSHNLSIDGWTVTAAADARGAFHLCKSADFEILIMPLSWPGNQDGQQKATLDLQNGLMILENFRALLPRSRIIVFEDRAGGVSISDYCYPFLHGADYLLDGSSTTFIKELFKIIERHLGDEPLTKRLLSEEGLKIIEQLGLVTRSPLMAEVLFKAEKAAAISDTPVLITGESGVGKELIAEAIHKLDKKRRAYPFIAINCGAISGSLAESEMFGHKRGAYTGAVGDRSGYFRAAHRGTIFLDEIGEMEIGLQTKLLRIVQEKRVLPVGEDVEREIDVRIIAATNGDLSRLVKEGKFRLDLYHRLNVLPIHVPPLRERKEDIEPLLLFFAARHRGFYKPEIEAVDPKVVEALQSLDYSGNIRELENLTRRILFNKESGNRIEMRDLPKDVLERVSRRRKSTDEDNAIRRLFRKIADEGLSLQQVMEHCERLLIQMALEQTKNNRSRAASLLKTTPRNIFYKVKRYNLLTLLICLTIGA